MSSTEINYKHCACCQKTIRKDERMHLFDLTQEWCKFVIARNFIHLHFDHSCYMRVYHEMQRNLSNSESLEVCFQRDIGTQTDSLGVSSISVMSTTTTTASHLHMDYDTERTSYESHHPNITSAALSDNVIKLPFYYVSASRRRCSICSTYYEKTLNPWCSVSQATRSHALISHGIFIPKGSTCCKKHLDNDCFTVDSIQTIKNNNPSFTLFTQDQLMDLFYDIKMTFQRIQQLLDEVIYSSPINFDDNKNLKDEHYFTLMGISKENFNDLCSKIPSNHLRQSELRSARQAIGCFLLKMRLGISNQVLAVLFSLPDKRAASRIIDSVRVSLVSHFVPNFLGFSHISRSDIIENHTRPLARFLFTNSNDEKAILVLDGTYIYVQKSANNLLQRRTFSVHKSRPLIKPMMIVATDGYIISTMGPYLSDFKNNDASMTKHIVLNNQEGIVDWLRQNDMFIVDRGFRDCLSLLNKFGYGTHTPSFLKKGEKQFPTNEDNQTRFVTKIRWVVESVNGRIKTWHFFSHVVPNSILPVVGDLFSIVCALINAYRPLFVRDVSKDKKLADLMLDLVSKNNKLKEYIDNLKNKEKKNIKWTSVDGKTMIPDFPRMTLDQLYEITFSWFRLKQAKSYAIEHLSDNGEFPVQISKQLPNTLRARIQSRHRNSIAYELYVEYSESKVKGWCCQCPRGNGIIGCCSHVAGLMWYLAFARHDPHLLVQRSATYVELIDDALDCSDVSSDESDEDDYDTFYTLA